MQEQVQKYLNPIKDKWSGLERDQKMKIVIAVLVLAISLAAFMYITLRPKQTVLKGNLNYSDIGEIEKVLDENTIKYTTTSDSIIVDEKDVNRANVILATAGVPTSGNGYTYTDAFSNSGMTTTDSVKKESFRLAAQTSIEQSLEMLDGVQDAKVTIVPQQNNNYFVKDQAPASANVVLKTSKEISKNEGLIMARTVALSVEGLTLDNIEITDQNFTPIYSGDDQVSSISIATTAYEQEQLRGQNIANAVKLTLKPLYSEVFVNPNVVMDWDEEVESRVDYTTPDQNATNTGFVDSTITDKSNYTGTTPMEAPGTATNGQPTTYDTGNSDSSTASTNKGQTEYIYNESSKQIRKQPGIVNDDKSSIAVTVYNNKIYDEKVLKDSGELDNLNMTWEQYKASIPESTALTIDPVLQDSIAKGTGITNVSFIGYEVPVFIDETKTPVDIRQIIMFVVLALLILMLALGLIRNTQREEITEVEPELSVEDLLLSTQIEEEREIQRLKEIEFNADNETKKQIDKFVTEKPDAVAQLLRNWLSEDWE